MSYARPTTWAAVLLAVAMIGTANADPLNPRPVIVSGDSLQSILDAMTVGGPGIDVDMDQVPYAMFTSGASGGAVVTFAAGGLPNGGTGVFGVYDWGSHTRVDVFGRQDRVGGQKLLSFREDGSVRTNLTQTAPVGSFSSPSSFGFFLDVYDADTGAGGDGNPETYDYTLYVEDGLNPGGQAQALVFQGDDETIMQIGPFSAGLFTHNEFIIAFEDVLLASVPGGGGYSSLVVLIESIAPIPAPTALLLGALGLPVVCWVRRRLA